MSLQGGFNYAREEAMAIGQEFGFRPVVMGVMLHLNNDALYARKGVYVIEDLR